MSAVPLTGLVVPKVLFGYEVLDFIGEGAGSVIYAVSHPQTRQLYALKHVIRKTDKHDRYIEQLEAEFEVGQGVNHRGLRRSIDLRINRTVLRKPTDAALVLELFDGQPLENDPPRDLLDIVDCFIQTAQALDSLHNHGWVHCDLKPNNILRNPQGEVKVIDLGQACKTGTTKTRIQGTPDYISPEQVKCNAVTPRTDIFNFGATLYWTLAGKTIPTLFTLKKDENSFLVDAQIASPRDLNPTVPEPLSNLVMHCIKTTPANRPENMSEVVRRLEVMQHSLRRARTAAAPNAPAAPEAPRTSGLRLAQNA